MRRNSTGSVDAALVCAQESGFERVSQRKALPLSSPSSFRFTIATTTLVGAFSA